MTTVADHLTLNKLRKRVKKAKDPVERTRFLEVHHAKRGLTAKEIARITLHTLHTARWVQQVVRRYNQEGPEALQDKRLHNPGQRPELTPEEQQRGLKALQCLPPHRGFWTGVRVDTPRSLGACL